MNPKISVIIPIYNTACYLDECLNSVINQSIKDIEIICVNDGSTDNSVDILKKFMANDKRVQIINREYPSGSAAVPRNLGLDIAKGKYIYFLDSDDYLDLGMLEKLYSVAESKKVELVMCDNYIVSGIDGTIKEVDGELHHKYIKMQDVFSYKDIPDTIFQISNAAIWHKLILRDVITRNELRFQEGVPILDDIYFVNLLLVLSKNIYILDEKLIYYRQVRSGAQTGSIEKHVDSIFYSFEKLNEYLIENEIYHEIRVSLQNWILITMAWWYYSIRNHDIAKDLFYSYKNEYFSELHIMDMELSEVYEENIGFYNHVITDEFKPTANVILYSVFSEGTKLVLYGAGKLGKDMYKCITNEQIHKIVLWCDKNAANIDNPVVQLPEKIVTCDYDMILIAIGDRAIVADVTKYLESLGVDKEKIYFI